MYAPGILRVVELTALMLMAIHIVMRIAEYLRPDEDSSLELDDLLAELPQSVYESREQAPSSGGSIMPAGQQQAQIAC